MNRLLYFLLLPLAFLLGSPVAQAQTVSIVDLSPPSGPLQIDQLRWATVSNLGGEAMRGTLTLVLTNATGEPIARSVTNPLDLAPRQVIGQNELWWSSQVVFGSVPAAAALRQTGLLPPGEYNLCFEFNTLDGTRAGVTCSEKRATPLSQFRLLFPSDGARVTERQPILSWEPALGFVSEPGDLRYELHLTQLRPGQSPQEAIERNAPLLTRAQLTTTSLLYPAGAPELQPKATYAWRVNVYNGRGVLANSATWRFTLQQKDVAEETPQAGGYVMVATTPDRQFCVFDRAVNLAFDNNEGVTDLEYTIVDVGDTDWKPKSYPPLPRVVPGLNTFSIPVNRLGLKKDRRYQLQFTTPRGQAYFLRFKRAT